MNVNLKAIAFVALVVALPPQALAQADQRQPTPLTLAEERMLKPGDVFRECQTCRDMVVVPSGSFTMGSPTSEEDRELSEGPTRKVKIGFMFAVGKFELTIAEWQACVRDNGCDGGDLRDEEKGLDDMPVERLWSGAKDYVAWLSKKTGKSYRLLTESEWEYAARAGTTTPYAFGRSIRPEQANYNTQGTQGAGSTSTPRYKLMPVGSFAPNAFRLHDMHGNISEWVEDCWFDSYRNAPSDGRARTKRNCDAWVVRGGSWSLSPHYLRSAARANYGVESDIATGFRIARTLKK